MSRHERRRAASLSQGRGLSDEDTKRLLKNIAGTVAQSIPGHDVTVVLTTRDSETVNVNFATTAEDPERIGVVVRGLGDQLITRAKRGGLPSLN